MDTGWINDEKPIEKAAAHEQRHGFQAPLDEVDAAARILDPQARQQARGDEEKKVLTASHLSDRAARTSIAAAAAQSKSRLRNQRLLHLIPRHRRIVRVCPQQLPVDCSVGARLAATKAREGLLVERRGNHCRLERLQARMPGAVGALGGAHSDGLGRQP